ncbi:CNH-domain-containing protein [Melanogaster broomeanus]|nr:CNH-domain-containing protein [Melanogaster broomeanus]
MNDTAAKLEETIGLRNVVQESNKVFEMEPLSRDTFFMLAISAGTAAPAWNPENSFTGKVTCSVPFNSADGRALVAIGCADGVWIGFRHDSRSMRRVLHLKMVTQCAMLEDFGMFLVLADKGLFAYRIEDLVPSSPQSAHTPQSPQRENGTGDADFFSVGNQGGRTLVIYMKKKGLDSVFRVLEPVVEKLNERSEAPASFASPSDISPARSEWFRLYREFLLPSESFDLVFLKSKIAILCTKGFEITDLTDFKSVTIPLFDDGHERLAKRCESCKPIGIFRVENEFLLCYDEFGIYVDKHGGPSRPSGTIEWEGTAERVALHWPYVLLFDSRFIEVRHVSTGLLAQIIPGNEIWCIWDGRGTSGTSTVTGVEGVEQPMGLDPRVHAVMSTTETVGQLGLAGPPQAIAQHVFELAPTVPLYRLGSLASPS